MTKMTKEQRAINGAKKLNELIDNAKSGEVALQATGGVKDAILEQRSDIIAEPAKYTGSLPHADRIQMFNIIKK